MSTDWIDTTLGEVLTLQRGMDLPVQDRRNGQVPIVASTGIAGYHDTAPVKGPGVVIGRSGSIGGGQFIKDDFWPLNTTLWVKDFKGNDPRYCYYLLKSIDFTAMNAGSGVPTLNRNHLHPMPVLRPTVKIQKGIATTLGALDDRIELLRETNATLEAIAQALFKSWFVDFDPVHANAGTQAPSLPPEIQALFPATFTDSAQGPIPDGWKAGQIGDVISIKGGYAFKSSDFQDSGSPVIKIKNIVGDGTVDCSDVQRVSESVASKAQRFILNSGDILIAMTGATIGKVGIYVSEANQTALVNQRVAKFENKNTDEKNTWLAFIAFSNSFMTEQVVNAASGSAQPNISSSGIESAKLVVPADKNVLKAFNSIVDPIFQSWISNQKTVRLLSDLRDTLLPRLISGQLRLPEAKQAIAAITD